jgi:TolB-like protein/Tfp pilus assembly protein PilF
LSNPPTEGAPEGLPPNGPGTTVPSISEPPSTDAVPASEPHAHVSVLARIKEHKIAQWTLAYAAFAFAALHAVTLLSDALEWQHIIVRSVTLLLIFGLPIVSILAWYHGVRALKRVSGSELIIIALLLVIGRSLLWLVPRPTSEHAKTETAVVPIAINANTNSGTEVFSPPAHSIAVLPFTDMSEKKDQEYFADGMAEELIDMLTKVQDLRVPARTSSFYFKGKSEDIPTIARRLMVAHVLEGSVRKYGNHLRVTAQLVRADSGYHLWSQTYDRDLDDVFKVQDEIANAVVQALQISLMGGPLTRREGGTQNLEAYQLLLRAKNGANHGTKESLETAREQAERAIKLDPDFALAQALLGSIIIDITQIRALPVRDGVERARQLAQHALQITPDLVFAHLVLGYIHRTYDLDWEAAQTEVRQALEIDPVNSDVLTVAGQVSATLGHWDDAERQLRAALVRDPLNTTVQWTLAKTMYRTGRFAAAEAAYRKLIEFEPKGDSVHAYLGKTLLAEGKAEAALAMVQQESLEGDRLDILPIVLQVAGRQADADAALKLLAAKFADSDAYYVAMNYAYRDDHDLALQWLERAYKQKDIGFVEIVGEPLFKNLAADPRYKAFLRKMNLPE